MNTLTVQEAAAKCRCHTDSIYQAIRDGKLRAKKVGRAWVILERNLETFLDDIECSTDAANSGTPDLQPTENELIDPQELLTKRRLQELKLVGGTRSGTKRS